jgi:hypothetical protein
MAEHPVTQVAAGKRGNKVRAFCDRVESARAARRALAHASAGLPRVMRDAPRVLLSLPRSWI